MTWKRTILSFLAACLAALPALADWSAGVAAFNGGDLRTAETEFRAMTESQPDWPGGHLMLGQTLLRDGRTAEALAPLERARELAPGDFQTAFALGQAQILLKKFAAASEVLDGLDPAPLPAPQRLAFYRARVAAFSGAGDHSRALPDLEAAVAIEPGDADLHRKLAQTARAAGRAELAIAHYGRASELDPRDSESVESLVELVYARAVSGDDSRQTALCREILPHARKLVELDDSYENLILLAKVASCVGMEEAARDTLIAAVAARPDDWQARCALGRTYVQLKAWAEARAAFEDALMKKVPEAEKPAVHDRLGYAFEQLKKPAEALEHYRIAGSAEAIARVEQNLRADKEEARIKALAEEKARIERELAALGKSGI